MSSWGANDSAEAKPKWLSATEQAKVYATPKGWVYKDSGTGLEEVLVAIGSLSGKLNKADVTSVAFTTTSLAAGSRTITCTVTFNEKVVVTGTPQLVVDNGNQSGEGNGDYTLNYSAGTGTQTLTFTRNSRTVSATDVLSIGGASPSAAAITLNGGTILDDADDTVGSIAGGTITTGATVLPTAAIDNTGVTNITAATIGAVTAKVHSATVVAGGSNYSVGNEITIANGFGTGTNAVLTVATVNSGAVLTATVKAAAPGAYTAIASGVTGIGQQSVNTGSGSGATFNLTLGVASVAVSGAGSGYSAAPTITFGGTGLDQANGVVTMVGNSVALATTGATQKQVTVVA